METNSIRKKFLDYFNSKAHQIVASSTLVPVKDATLLFTNSGMVQFKDIFLGDEISRYPRAVSIQKCMRAGGKHNDLENVGYTARHHTFFEMCGNFSFGDYFKREAIQFAWDFVTQELNISQERLWVTVFEEDKEAENIWINEIGISPHRISRCGAKDNFWSMGDTGPCGPCSEIFYDHGEEIPGGPPGSLNEDGDRFTEIWNLVFMQYNRNALGQLSSLPKPSVDTGMGLERIAAVLQGVHDNYEIDLFKILIHAIEHLPIQNKNSLHFSESNQKMISTSKKVIADHIRSTGFLIHEGVVPSNEGHGYVLRRIIRRALRHGYQLGLEENFFHQLVPAFVEVMAPGYPELKNSQSMIEKIICNEEQQFNRTLAQGLKTLEKEFENLNTFDSKVLPGSIVFKLYDTYGFPPDLTADIARERECSIDETGFQKCMNIQRQNSQMASNFSAEYHNKYSFEEVSEFLGYEFLEQTATIIAIFKDEKPVQTLKAGEKGWIILNRTPFYAESGGQVGDQGIFISPQGIFEVEDTQSKAKAHLHIGYVKEGTLNVSQTVTAQVDIKKRHAAAINHTATHLLHAALHQLLGSHVKQKGSLVSSERLRFDFSHFESIPPQKITDIERLVNQQIRANTPVLTDLMSMDEAKAAGAMALFDEKYSDQVRVLTIKDFSKELCGGTHVRSTGEIGLFKITQESAIAAGIRRIEAVTGTAALNYVETIENTLTQTSALLNCTVTELHNKVQNALSKIKQQEKELEKYKQQRLFNLVESSLSRKKDIQGTALIVERYDELSSEELRIAVQMLKQKIKEGVIVLASIVQEKVFFVIGIPSSNTTLRADSLAQHLATYVGGKGGGKADFAQAGGNKPDQIEPALQSVPDWLVRQKG